MKRFPLSRSMVTVIIMTLLLASCMSGVPISQELRNTVPKAIIGETEDLQGSIESFGPYDSPAYFVSPRIDRPHGSVLLVHDKKGLTDRIKKLADEIAAEGYSVLAPDFYRGKNPVLGSSLAALPGNWFSKKEDQFALIDGAIEFLRSRDLSNQRVALIGWSVGADTALAYALEARDNDGTALFFGELPEDPEVFYQLRHELYGTYRADDNSGLFDQLHKIQYVQRSSGFYSNIYAYPNVDKEFWLYVDDNPEKNSAAAEDAWIRLKIYLYRTVGGREKSNVKKKY